jgi:hypothetical protein
MVCHQAPHQDPNFKQVRVFSEQGQEPLAVPFCEENILLRVPAHNDVVVGIWKIGSGFSWHGAYSKSRHAACQEKVKKIKV